MQDKKLRDLLLEAADRILNGTAARNKIISKGPRQRKKHPLRVLLEVLMETYSNRNHVWLRNEVIAKAIKKGLIYQNDTDRERIVFNDENTIDITYKTISVWVKDINKSKK